MTTALGCSGQVRVEFGPDTTYGRNTAWYPASGTSQTTTVLVAGMRAATTYHMRAVAQAQCTGSTNTFSSGDVTFTTGPLPPLPLPTLTVTRPNPSPSSPENPGIESIDITIPSTPAFLTDRDAYPIWYYDVGTGNYAFPFKLLPNGHMILNISFPSGDSRLREIDLAGNTIRELDIVTLQQKLQSAGYDFVPAFFHHDLLPLNNGHILALVDVTRTIDSPEGYSGATSVNGDAIVDLDQNWNPVWGWNSWNYLSVNRHPNGLPDWTHSNALIYSPNDGNVLVSMRSQSWILKIDYNNGAGSGNVLWKLGYEGDFALNEQGVASQDPSVWFWYQHFPSIVSQEGTVTTVAIWDNGDNRLDLTGTTCGSAPPYTGCYSRATLFQVDESAMVANLVWDDLPGYFGVWGGSINQLENGNVEFDLNAAVPPPDGIDASRVQEVTQIPNPEVIWQLDISPVTETAYRAYRVPSLYPGVTWSY